MRVASSCVALVCACAAPASAPAPAPAPTPAVAPAKVAPPPPAPIEAPAPSTIPGTDEGYRSALLREFRLRNRSRPVGTAEFAATGESPPYEVHAFRRIGRGRSHVALTVGLGATPRAAKPLHVELLAESKEYGPAIADVLAALGRSLRSKAAGASFKPYSSVQLTSPQHNLQFFDLVPAGTIDVDGSRIVTLMKVVPVSPEEFEAGIEGETQFAGRDDMTPEGADRALMRWAPALAQDPEESPSNPN